MSFTNFPNGITSFGIPILGSGDVITGNVFFVDSVTGSNSNLGTRAKPFATIDYAIGKCTATNGDVIYVLPTHVETISAAGGITCDVAGISIIGLGWGNMRPTITWSETASSLLVTAANVRIKNIRTTLSKDEVVSMVKVSAAGCILDTVDFVPYGALGATGQALQFLLTTADADDLVVANCRHLQYTATAGDTIWIQLVGTDNTRIINNSIAVVPRAATNSLAISGSTASTNVEIMGNRISWLAATVDYVIKMATNSTGVISDNRIGCLTGTAIATVIGGASCYVFENYGIDAVNSSGILTPAAGTYS